MTTFGQNITAANKGFAIAGVPCLADTFVQAESFVLRTKFSAKNPAIANPQTVSSHWPNQQYAGPQTEFTGFSEIAQTTPITGQTF